MRDIQLNALRETFMRVSATKPTIVAESRKILREDKIYLAEAKKIYPHLNESFLIENKALMENVNHFRTSIKDIKSAIPGCNYAQARAMQKAIVEFSVADYYARSNVDDMTFLEKMMESAALVLNEREPFYGDQSISRADLADADPNDPDVKRFRDMVAAQKAAKGGKGPEDTMGPKMDFASGEEAPEPEKKSIWGKVKDFGKGVVSSGKEIMNKLASAPKEVKALIGKLRDSIKKVGDHIEKYNKIYKPIALAIFIFTLGLAAAAVGGWAAILFAGFRAIMSAYGIFKSSKDLIATGGEFAEGKKGMEAVKSYLKNLKKTKNALRVGADILLLVVSIFGLKSAVGEIATKIGEMINTVEPATFNPNGAPPKPPVDGNPAAPAAPAEAPAPAQAPAAPAQAPAAPPVDPAHLFQRAMEKAELFGNAAGGSSSTQMALSKAQRFADMLRDADLPKEKAFDVIEKFIGAAMNGKGAGASSHNFNELLYGVFQRTLKL